MRAVFALITGFVLLGGSAVWAEDKYGYGTHLVYVHDHQKEAPPEFIEVEEQVRKDWVNEEREQLNEQYMTSLIKRYGVTIVDVVVGEKSGVSKDQ
jgi:hypothetical protein